MLNWLMTPRLTIKNHDPPLLTLHPFHDFFCFPRTFGWMGQHRVGADENRGPWQKIYTNQKNNLMNYNKTSLAKYREFSHRSFSPRHIVLLKNLTTYNLPVRIVLPIGLSLASEVNLHMMLSSAVDHILNCKQRISDNLYIKIFNIQYNKPISHSLISFYGNTYWQRESSKFGVWEVLAFLITRFNPPPKLDLPQHIIVCNVWAYKSLYIYYTKCLRSHLMWPGTLHVLIHVYM